MGEMADFYLAQEMDAYGRSPAPVRGSAYGPPLKCKGCGASDVYWQRVRGQWRIHNRNTLDPHVCPGKLNPDDFQEVAE